MLHLFLNRPASAGLPSASTRCSAGNGRAADFFQPAPADALLMVDPLGNWFMVYPPKADPVADFKGILKDLKKLLKQSQVD